MLQRPLNPARRRCFCTQTRAPPRHTTRRQKSRKPCQVIVATRVEQHPPNCASPRSLNTFDSGHDTASAGCREIQSALSDCRCLWIDSEGPIALGSYIMKYICDFERPHNPAIDERFHQLTIASAGNVLYWDRFFEITKHVHGSIVEAGVGRGRSLLIMAAINTLRDASEGGNRALYGYDSFEGFPEPTSRDESFRHPKRGEWSHSPSGAYRYSPDFIRTVLADAGVTGEVKLTLIAGYFDRTLPLHPREPIAILHVDGDLYESYKATLENLYPLVSAGGVVVFDDFSVDSSKPDPFPGARASVREYFGSSANLRVSIAGKYFVVKE